VNELTASFRLVRGEFSLDVDFTAPGRGVTALFGPSGAGKTTVLRCAAGLERAAGRFIVDGVPWQDDGAGIRLPAHRRPVGVVFQDAGLFPHLSVRGNIAYGFDRVPAAERRLGFDEVVDWLGVEPLLKRRTSGLSGGEQQRIGIARALLCSPRLLLFDEPLASLDEPGRAEIMPYLEALPARLSIPILYVSHSLREVARLADHMIWLDAGRVRAVGPLRDVLTRLDLAAERRDDAGAVVDAVVAEDDAEFELSGLDSAFGRLWVPRLAHPVGDAVRVRLLARDVSLSLEAEVRSSILNCFPARVAELGASENGQVLVRLVSRVGDEPEVLLARITRKSCVELGLAPGTDVYARVKSVSLV